MIYPIHNREDIQLVLLDEALKLVEKYGSDVQRCRVAYVRKASTDNTPVLHFLEQLQLPEGGFPYQADPGNPYHLSYTSNILKILAETGLKRRHVSKRTVDFVMSVQSEEGFWNENPELASRDLPFWDQPGDLNTQLWLTGALGEGLIRLGHGSSFHIVKAGDFLLRHRKANGAFKGFRHTTWLAVAVLAPRRGITDSVVRDAVNALGAFGDWDPANLNWVLDSFYFPVHIHCFYHIIY